MPKTLTVGIPAYNEQENVTRLISAILAQKQDGFVLEKVIVVSDGSTDSTVERIKALRDPRIELIVHADRQGVAIRQTEVFTKAQSDVVALINADVLPEGNSFLAELVKPFTGEGGVGIVGARVAPLPPTSFLERVLYYSDTVKAFLFQSVRNRTEVFLCHGRTRAFSRVFYKTFVFPAIMNEDNYSYLYAVSHGFAFAYASKATVRYRLPRNIRDYLKQSHRFLNAQQELVQFLEPQFVRKHLSIPWSLKAKVAAKFLLERPLYMLSYLVLYGTSVVTGMSVNTSEVKWAEVVSTKKLYE